MKIYFIDKFGKYLSLKNKLEKLKNEEIEHKTDIKHRINKTDYVITLDFDNQYEKYKKVNNLIIATDMISKNEIWNMANKLNTRDIILISANEDYMAERINEVINGG